VSLGTLETTSTDRHYAARIATQNAASLYRLDHVSPIMVDAHAGRVDPRLNVGGRSKKAVDPSWLNKRQLGGPSAQDLSVLKMNDPKPTLRINYRQDSEGSLFFTLSNGLTLIQFIFCADDFPLRSSVNPISMQPEFTLDINFTDIFGSVFDDAYALWDYGELDRSAQAFERTLRLAAL
jgi:hypothetical protein